MSLRSSSNRSLAIFTTFFQVDVSGDIMKAILPTAIHCMKLLGQISVQEKVSKNILHLGCLLPLHIRAFVCLNPFPFSVAIAYRVMNKRLKIYIAEKYNTTN